MYPKNVCVHGNGFIQISLGGQPETRIHIWTEGLRDLTQKVNTQWHDHRFGFVSTVLRGALEQQEMDFIPTWERKRGPRGRWSKWTATGERLPTGNRPLVKQPRSYFLEMTADRVIVEGHGYSMDAGNFHRSVPLVFPTVTAFTKTVVIPEGRYKASVMCKDGLEPDQKFDRFQIPWDTLRRKHIEPALLGTPFESAELWE